MTQARARRLLREREGQELCVRYRCAPDGAIHFAPAASIVVGWALLAAACVMGACAGWEPSADFVLPEDDLVCEDYAGYAIECEDSALRSAAAARDPEELPPSPVEMPEEPTVPPNTTPPGDLPPRTVTATTRPPQYEQGVRLVYVEADVVLHARRGSRVLSQDEWDQWQQRRADRRADRKARWHGR